MQNSKLLSILLCAIFINFIISCAGTGIKREAESEFEVGLALFNQGQYEESMEHFERSTELNPEFCRSYLYIGRVYLNIGKWQEALPPLRHALRLAPEESNKKIAEILIDIFFKKRTTL